MLGITGETPAGSTHNLGTSAAVTGTIVTRRQSAWGILGVLGALALGTLGSCANRDKAIRYKIILDVDTPSGVKSGSSVVESDFRQDGLTFGQAPFVDLGNGSYLFALLTDPFSKKTLYGIVLNALRYPDLRPPLDDPQASAFAQAKRSKPQATLHRLDYPMLVTFSNIKDSKSVSEVDPDDLVASFGAGYRLDQITIQVVDQEEPLTEGLEDILTWIGSYPETRLSAGDPLKVQTVAEAPLSRRLSNLSFIYRSRK